MALGMSRESTFLADVLFTAQKEEYESTGRMVCMSETPIEKSPWFIYQGLQLGSGVRDWRLNGVELIAALGSKEAEQDVMAFVTKAAFLWAAYKSNEHSDRLLAYARQHTIGSIGFASNVNLKSQRAVLNYSDINTNALILQATAHMLRNDDDISGPPESVVP